MTNAPIDPWTLKETFLLKTKRNKGTSSLSSLPSLGHPRFFPRDKVKFC